MKKIIVCLVVLFACFSAQAAITEWTCWLASGSGKEVSLSGGTGYLLEITNGVEVSAISDHLKAKGLTGSITNINGCLTGSIANVKSVSSASLVGDEVTTLTPSLAANMNAMYCVLVANETSFAITGAYDFTNTEVWTETENTFNGAVTYSAIYDGLEGDVEKLGVPEPTALALLALGVAGLALRRKL